MMFFCVKLKVGKTGPIHKTTVKLSPDGAFLVWRAKRKGLRQARVPLEVVSRVTTGQVSRNFARLNASFFYKHANSEPGAEERSLSLGDYILASFKNIISNLTLVPIFQLLDTFCPFFVIVYQHGIPASKV